MLVCDAIKHRLSGHVDWSARLISGVIPGGSLVSMLVVSGQAGHELVRVDVLYLRQEPSRDIAAQSRGAATVVGDDDLVASLDVGEAGG